MSDKDIVEVSLGIISSNSALVEVARRDILDTMTLIEAGEVGIVENKELIKTSERWIADTRVVLRESKDLVKRAQKAIDKSERLIERAQRNVGVYSDDTEERVKRIIAQQLSISEPISNVANFKDTLGADSLDLMEITMELEDEFDCKIEDEQLDKILTVQQTIDVVNNCEKNTRLRY